MTAYEATAEEIGLQLGEVARQRSDNDTSLNDAQGLALMEALVESEILTDEDMLAALSVAAGLLNHVPGIIEEADPKSSFGLYVSLSCLDRVINNLELFTGTARESYTGIERQEH